MQFIVKTDLLNVKKIFLIRKERFIKKKNLNTRMIAFKKYN